MWLKEIIGHLLNELEIEDEQEDITEEFIGKVTSYVDNPFTLERYMTLKLADFTDDVTTVNPNELLGAGENPDQEDGNDQMPLAGANANI